jgi:GntR family transcriptional regulator/MocR family aminotransferase
MPTKRATLELFAPLDRTSPLPLRDQLENAICDAITGGGAPPGTRLPASRVLSEALGISRRVVSEAYAQIAAEGWIEVRHGAAPIVRAKPKGGQTLFRLEERGDGGVRVDLRATAPDLSLFPRRAWGAALRRAVAELPDAALDYGDPRGDEVLRAELAAYLVRVRGAAAADVVITSGYTQGLYLTCRVLKARGLRTVAVEDPSLDDTWRTIRAAGLQVVGVPVDDLGLRVDRLDADAVLVTPAHQFPTGAVLSPARRRALLAWGGVVIEDDYDSEYRYDRAPVGTLQRLAPDRVVYLGTTSKTLAPGLRLGWVVASPEFCAGVAAHRWRIDSGSPVIEARAYAHLIASGGLDRHLRRTRREYRERRDALVAALDGLEGCHVEGVAAGLHLLLRLPPGTDEDAVVAALAERRIRIRGLASYRLAPSAHDPALVVGYGRLATPAIAPTVAALRDVLSE